MGTMSHSVGSMSQSVREKKRIHENHNRYAAGGYSSHYGLCLGPARSLHLEK